MRKQESECTFRHPKIGDKFIAYPHLLHALGNSESSETREYKLREGNEITEGKCPLCGEKVKFDGTHWYCKPCSAEGILKHGELVICSCSAKGSMSDLVSNY